MITTLLLDRDGTVIEDPGYLRSPDQVVLLPGVIEGLQAFCSADVELFIVTNQSGVSRGFLTVEELHACNQRMLELLAEHNIPIASIVFCTDIDNESPNRKPNPGMWHQLQEDFPYLQADTALMVGDKDADVQFGITIGAKSARIDSGQYPNTVKPDYTVKNLEELAGLVL